MQDTVRHTCKETGKDDKVDSSIFQQRQYSCPVHPFGLAHTGERNIQTTCTFQNKGTLSISQNQLYVHQFAILEITDDILCICPVTGSKNSNVFTHKPSNPCTKP